jgi:hypothetical protein
LFKLNSINRSKQRTVVEVNFSAEYLQCSGESSKAHVSSGGSGGLLSTELMVEEFEVLV